MVDLLMDHMGGVGGRPVEAARLRQPCSAARASIFARTFVQPLLMFSKADSFFGSTKPEWTRRMRVPVWHRGEERSTTVSSREP